MRERLFITGRNSEPEQIGPDWEPPPPYILYTINRTALNVLHSNPILANSTFLKRTFQTPLCSDCGHFTFWQQVPPIKSSVRARNCPLVFFCAHLVKLLHNNFVQLLQYAHNWNMFTIKNKMCTFWKILLLPASKSTGWSNDAAHLEFGLLAQGVPDDRPKWSKRAEQCFEWRRWTLPSYHWWWWHSYTQHWTGTHFKMGKHWKSRIYQEVFRLSFCFLVFGEFF